MYIPKQRPLLYTAHYRVLCSDCFHEQSEHFRGGIEKGKGLWSLQYLSLAFVFLREKRRGKVEQISFAFSIRDSRAHQIDGKRKKTLRKKRIIKKKKKFAITDSVRI